jgi:histidinol-phosphate/aromatic aminotransferase/cobyric acid decarboxylase-like protein/GNAT superfamily N-acetyltransferase
MVIPITLASADDRRAIYALRHEVYARELAQHHENDAGEIRDALDDGNVYIVAKAGGAIAGFVSITPPQLGRYSIEKYLSRDAIPFPLDAGTFEIRILTVLPAHRGTIVATLLMYAALRWVEANGGARIIAIGRREVRDMYENVGLRPFGSGFRSGAVDFVPMTAAVSAIRDGVSRALLGRMERAADWNLIVPFHKPAECFHGGAFFDAIGDEFDHLERRETIINADVLDAWFPPSPAVVDALREHLPWLLRTSPPTGCDGMIRAIARARGVDAKCILPGSGSSSLIYLALREWLTPASRVLLPDPTYGEYAHVLEKVIRCRVEWLTLTPENGYAIDPERFHGDHDLIVLVNPNSPTGRHIRRAELEPILARVPSSTLVWIDETYVEYAGAHESLERFAVTRPNVVVCKSMSKVYALSGARCAYLCASPHLLERLRGITPPWAVGLPSQVAAVAALNDDRYYAARYRTTHDLRNLLGDSLSPLMTVFPGTANFLLCRLDEDGPTAEEVTLRCRAEGLFIRDAANMGKNVGRHTIRIAVKDRATIARMAQIVARAVCHPERERGNWAGGAALPHPTAQVPRLRSG